MGFNGDNETESGVYYIVPDRSGKPGSKRVVRRPRAPLTSVPLDEDFDTITRMTMYTGKGRYSWVPTQPSLDDQFDAITYTNTNTNFEKIDEVDEELEEVEEVEETEGGRETVTRIRREEQEGDNIEHDTRRNEPRIGQKFDVFHRYRRASTSRVDDYGYRNQRSRAESRVLPPFNPQNGHYNSYTRPSEDFASRYVPPREQRTPRPGYTNGNAEPSQLLRSASRRSSNRNYSHSQFQTHDYTRASGRENDVYRVEEIVQRVPSTTPRRRRESGLSRHSRSRSRSRSRIRTPVRPHAKAVSTTPPHVRPPGRHQSYEVVKSRVLEDTPEKTVTISTWRERVAEANGVGREGNGEEETRMSVYYIDADDYPVEDRNGRVIELEQRVLEREKGGVEWMGSKSPRMVPKRTMSNGGSRKGKEKDEKPQSSKDDIRDRVLTPWPSMSELGDIDDELQRENDDDGARKLTHRRSRSLPVDLDWRDLKEELDPAYDKSANITHPRTSTPIRDPHLDSSTSPPRALSLLPTRSNGSTISSIRERLSGTPRPSTSTQPSSIHPPPHDPRSVSEVLTSCKPSLMHLEPILYDLGIRTEDHLKAVGKMSEGTRDREIKKVAVEKGVTVLEWAMLIDKMQNL